MGILGGISMKNSKFDSVPVALPRRWVKNWMLNLWNIAFGQTLGTKQPFRWILFRELSARERLKLLDRNS